MSGFEMEALRCLSCAETKHNKSLIRKYTLVEDAHQLK